MRSRRLTGVAIGLALSSIVVGSGSAQTPCETLLDYYQAGDDWAGRVYELRCGDLRLGLRFRPRVPKPALGGSERVIDTREIPLVQAPDDMRDQLIVLADDIREDFLDRPEE